MTYEWDEDKNFANFLKHKVWFEEAQVIWTDERGREFFDSFHSENEDRWIRIGLNPGLGILLVVFCEKNDLDTVRIISARRADKDEKNFYWFGD